MSARPTQPGTAPVLMAAMARVTGNAAAVAALPAPVLSEMAQFCACCPRTAACVEWLAAQGTASALPASDLCPNHAIFAALAGRSPAP